MIIPVRLAAAHLALAAVVLPPCSVGSWLRGELAAVTAAMRATAPALAPTATPPVQPPAPPPPPAPPLPPRDQLPAVADALVLRALEHEQVAFTRCFAHAREADPSLGPTTVKLHATVDADGSVRAVDVDLEDRKLAACFANAAKRLHFPAPGRFAVANITLVG